MSATQHPYFQQRFAALAHRGGARLAANEGRENTLAAFQNAVALGYTHIETDVHVTADGHLVAFHDTCLDRVSDGSGRIADLPLDAVKEVSIGGEKVPTLDEVLEALPQCRINIDIKAPGAERPLVQTLQRHAAMERVCVGSFSEIRLNRYRVMAGTLAATSVGPAGVLQTVAAARIGLGIAPLGLVYQVPMTTHIAGREVKILTPEFVEQAHRWGRHVHVWTIDDAPVMHRLIDWGVDGLVSDRIDVLRDVLTERGLWQTS